MELQISGLSRTISLRVILVFIIFSNVNLTQSRARPRPFYKVKPQDTIVEIKFIEPGSDSIAETDPGLYFQTDAEREEELLARHPQMNSPNFPKPPGKVLGESHGVPPGSKDEDFEKSLEQFIEWVKKKGLPDNILPTTRKDMNDVISDILDREYSIAMGGGLACESEGHLKGPDGVCRELADF